MRTTKAKATTTATTTAITGASGWAAAGLLGLAGVLGAGACSGQAPGEGDGGDGGAGGWTPPTYGDDFAAVWRDGRAELAGYDLTYPRYGQPRTGTAVMVTVTEPFNGEKRVKADAAGDETYEVVKLNLAEDFQTGVYDYNLMTSVFVATESANGLPAGSPTKVSFSAQEWCGQVFQQALFSKPRRGRSGVELATYSYFEDEADRPMDRMDHPAGGLAEEALVLWARGLAGPTLGRGESVELPVFRGLAVQRLGHVGPAWVAATLSRGEETEAIDTPSAGAFDCEVYRARVEGRDYAFYVDAAADGQRRIVKMTRSDGYALVLRGVERLPYWRLNGNADEAELEKFGMPRGGAARGGG